jgi:riboflavin kinase
MKELKILLVLGKEGALERNITITTANLGKELKIPQQTISRFLIKLTKKGLITRAKGIKGYVVGITPKGKELLKDLDITLDEILKPKEVVIKGIVTDGLKDGKYYLGLNEYRRKIKNQLNFIPFPGTLNITLNEEELKEKLQRMNGIEIEGFKKNDRIFGSIKCFKCKVNDVDASIIIPKRSHYGSNILEIISRFELRKKLNLKNGDEVVVEVIR